MSELIIAYNEELYFMNLSGDSPLKKNVEQKSFFLSI